MRLAGHLIRTETNEIHHGVEARLICNVLIFGSLGRATFVRPVLGLHAAEREDNG
jgi:hypothetical protein